MKPIHTVQRWLAALLLAALAAQFLLAGAGAFGATSFKAHTGLGWATAGVSLILLVVALAARRAQRASAILCATVVLQVVLGVLGTKASAWFGALHALNALAVVGAAVNLARQTAPANAGTPVGVPPNPRRQEAPGA
ncbi:MAG TPA: DUF6220 domain-containing protein [Solirubrobacteraceae bacterium]|jgi:hypothetical protein|nr:DUF6220 domain-containing protein [Solirubrobacteraceae bacterium]